MQQATASNDRVARIEELLGELESNPDPVLRQQAGELVAGVVEMYGEGLARIVERVAEQDGDDLLADLADDELVAHLLLLHDLHPVPVEQRVGEALASVRPYLESHGGDVEVLGISDGVLRLRLQGTCNGCPSSTLTLKSAIEEAIQKHAPDVEEIVAEGAVEPAQVPASSPLLQVECPAPSGSAPPA